MTRLWKAWEVARELRVPVARVEGWIREGMVDTVRTGRNSITLIPQAEVDRLIFPATTSPRPEGPTAPKLHKAQEVAAALHVPIARVKRWVREGKVLTVNADSIPAAEVERFIARSIVPARPAAVPRFNDEDSR